MKVWLKQRHGVLDTWRPGVAAFEGSARVAVFCPDTDNVLIDCSRAFYDAQVAQGRIIPR